MDTEARRRFVGFNVRMFVTMIVSLGVFLGWVGLTPERWHPVGAVVATLTVLLGTAYAVKWVNRGR